MRTHPRVPLVVIVPPGPLSGGSPGAGKAGQRPRRRRANCRSGYGGGDPRRPTVGAMRPGLKPIGNVCGHERNRLGKPRLVPPRWRGLRIGGPALPGRLRPATKRRHQPTVQLGAEPEYLPAPWRKCRHHRVFPSAGRRRSTPIGKGTAPLRREGQFRLAGGPGIWSGCRAGKSQATATTPPVGAPARVDEIPLAVFGSSCPLGLPWTDRSARTGWWTGGWKWEDIWEQSPAP